MDLLLIILGIIPFALLGAFVFWMTAKIIVMNGDTEETISQLESTYGAAQIKRRDAMNAVLYMIGKPGDARGTFNAAQNDLWQKYLALEKQDQVQTKAERDHLVNLQVRISDEEQTELDAGINPYR